MPIGAQLVHRKRAVTESLDKLGKRHSLFADFGSVKHVVNDDRAVDALYRDLKSIEVEMGTNVGFVRNCFRSNRRTFGVHSSSRNWSDWVVFMLPLNGNAVFAYPVPRSGNGGQICLVLRAIDLVGRRRLRITGGAEDRAEHQQAHRVVLHGRTAVIA